jgi:small-conductance mechanosensitive channel
MTRHFLVSVLVLAVTATTAFTQESILLDPQASGPVPADREVTLTYANRPITTFRAHLLSRQPADRAAAAVRVLDDLVARGLASPVATKPIGPAFFVTLGGEPVFAILPADVDVLSGETVEGAASAAASRLTVAVAEASELRAPARLLRSMAEAVGITLVLLALLAVFWRLHLFFAGRLARAAERKAEATLSGQVVRETRVIDLLRRFPSVVIGACAVVLVYLWAAFVLRRFPYTRPWGESLRVLLFHEAERFGVAFVDALPGLLTVLFIIVIARWASKAAALLFAAVEQGRLSLPGVYSDTAAPTRRLITVLIWLLAAAAAYPSVPGSNSEGFRGISVFVGLIVSLGSTGIVQQLMSGLMLTFARAVRAGDYARIGDVEGTILQIGALATKVRTPFGEEVTIPNAVVVTQTTANYSRGPDARAAWLPTSVTIGYDAPWRQVEALLLDAAQVTPGLRQAPAPVVWRMALEDYYVKYTLLVAPENPCDRFSILDQLHARILDSFNRHGVQIMSPHYMADPSAAKIVAPSDWYKAPASPATVPGETLRDPAALGS